MNWKQFVKENGHKYKLSEMYEMFPEIKPNSIKCFCYYNKIDYIRGKGEKSPTYTGPMKKETSVFFNVKDKYNWLIG